MLVLREGCVSGAAPQRATGTKSRRRSGGAVSVCVLARLAGHGVAGASRNVEAVAALPIPA
jgi:hypothetical protein